MRVLLVEDDPDLAETLVVALVHQGYTVDRATDGRDGWEKAQKLTYDLMILDVGLPHLDGISLCKKLRSQNIINPIILLTAYNHREDKVKGFDAGADDYVVKPFDIQELLARIRAILRRQQQIPSTLLEWENLHLDTNTCEVTYQQTHLNLTPKEYGLLELFLKHHQQVFSLDLILEKLWTFEDPPTENTVRAHIKGLRNKLKNVGAPSDLIETVYGIGYRLKQQSHPKIEPKKNSKKSEPNQDKLNQAIVEIWHRYQGKIFDRITLLEEFSLSHQQEKPDQNIQKARQEAHKLAGSLGTFGLGGGSIIAREIEQLCQNSTLNLAEITLFQKLVSKLKQEVEQYSPASTRENSQPTPIKSDHQVWIISQDQLLIESVQIAANNLGIKTQILTDLSLITAIQLQSHKKSYPPLVFLDFDFYFSYELLTQLTQQTPPIPVIVLTQQKNLTQRVKVAQFGGQGFLEKPITSEQIIKLMMDTFRQNCSFNAKVLIVDDDAQILATFQTLLEPWGIQTFTVEDPRNFWEILKTTTPDLLILDIEMPYLDGIELCQIVRADSRWKSLPVMFLTAHTNRDLQHQVFMVGADDYLTKTTEASILVNRILNRLRRTQSLRESST
ncbi:Multi-component transcriptional regulator, winged helix family [Planktothrix sp. PCC 11201]|uniref:response regulator n=1 Tax=Planktothrix sp. PCC 11201 TaxID=1729650 RepID=UPI0009222094|nr:response regulator [Planktothrix sp. PCC 11201]SKB13962.1 Multi-component transcriptional regulator, winged helix family [Planktothrix sp. PCC 11201]